MTQLVTNASPLFPTRVEVADANYTVTQTNGLLIAYTSLTAPRVVNLPASGLSPGQVIEIVDESGNCNLTNTITIIANGTDSIEISPSRIINYPYGALGIENGGNGRWVVMTNPNPNLSAGMQAQPSFTDLGTGSVTIGTGTYALFTNPYGRGKIKAYSIVGGTYTMTDGVTNYIVANYNNGSPTLQVITDVSLITNLDVVPVFTIYRSGTTLYDFEWDQLGDGLTNKLQQSIIKTQRYRAEPGGFGLGEAATRIVTIGSGKVWSGAVPTVLSAFNSSTNPLIFVYHSAGAWTLSTVTQYNNTQYDDGTNLQTTPGGKYVVNFIYRGVSQDTDAFYILGNQAYSLGAAQVAQPPGSLPPVISSHCILVGRIIVNAGASTATQIDSAFSTQFTPTAAVDHNSLANLQGGTANEYYHLTSAEYTGTGTGNFVRLNAPTLTGNVSSTSFNFMTGLASVTPLMDGAAAVGTATAVARQDHVHPTDTSRQAAYTNLTSIGSLANAAGLLRNNGSGTFTYDTTAYLSGTKVDSFNTRTGAVTLTSSDVTTALGYTPINKAGDSGIGALSMGDLTATSGTFGTSSGINYATVEIKGTGTYSVGGYRSSLVIHRGATTGNQSGLISLGTTGGTSLWGIGNDLNVNGGGDLYFYNGLNSTIPFSISGSNVFSFQSNPVSMGALTATAGTFSGTISTGKASIYDDGNVHFHASSSPLWIESGDNSPVYINYGGGQTILGGLLQAKSQFTNQSSYINYCYLGVTDDGVTDTVVLLHPAYNGTLIQKYAFDGEITFQRGDTGGSNITDTYDIKTSTAYNSNTGFITSRAAISVGSLVTCIYSGTLYVALYVPKASLRSVYYKGDLLSSFNVPQVFSASSVTSVTTLSNNITSFGGPVSTQALSATTGTFSGLGTFNAGLSLAANYGLAIADGAPGVTTSKLYSIATGSLQWSGSTVLTSGNIGGFSFYQAPYTNLTSIGSLANAAGLLRNDGTGVFSYDTTAYLSGTKVDSFNTRTGAVVLSSADVTTALGFTPINKAGDTGVGDLSIGALTATTTKTSVYTVATLPAGVDGMRAFVTDATATTFASVVAGGGTNHVPVYYDGGASSWKIG